MDISLGSICSCCFLSKRCRESALKIFGCFVDVKIQPCETYGGTGFWF